MPSWGSCRANCRFGRPPARPPPRPPVAHDDDDRCGGKGIGGAKNVLDQRQAARSVQNLGKAGFHPCSLAGRKDDQVERVHRRFRALAAALSRGRVGEIAEFDQPNGAARGPDPDVQGRGFPEFSVMACLQVVERLWGIAFDASATDMM